MYILKNAIRNIARSKGRNFLIGIIVFIISASSLISLSIMDYANQIEEEGINALSITANINVDRQKIMEDARKNNSDMKEGLSETDRLSLSELKKYAKADSVKSFSYTMSTSVNGNSSLEAVDTSSNSSSNESQFGRPNGGNMNEQGDFTLLGYSSYEAMSDFDSGNKTLSSGELFTEAGADNTCIINKELATLNKLEVGDKITVVNPNDTSEKYKLKITGIYQDNSSSENESNSEMMLSPSMDLANQIYTNYDTVKSITDKSTKNSTSTKLRSNTSGTYYFEDVESYEKFESQARELGLKETYTVSSNDIATYERSLAPLKNLSKFAKVFLIIVLIIGSIILIALNIFSIRERKYEVGVLTAIGMNKKKVALQFIYEVFIVTFISIIIATGVGSAVSVPISNQLLESQITSQTTSSNGIEQGGGQEMPGVNNQGGFRGRGGMAGIGEQTANYISEINASINFTNLIQVFLIGIGLTLISNLASALFIMRYEPLKILSERS